MTETGQIQLIYVSAGQPLQSGGADHAGELGMFGPAGWLFGFDF
jgi:hypothetical protein